MQIEGLLLMKPFIKNFSPWWPHLCTSIFLNSWVLGGVRLTSLVKSAILWRIVSTKVSISMKPLTEWQLAEKTEAPWKNLVPVLFVHDKSHMPWHGLEPGHLPPPLLASIFSSSQFYYETLQIYVYTPLEVKKTNFRAYKTQETL
jgi:hypothetical protein